MKFLKLLALALVLAVAANAQQRTKNAIIGDAKQALRSTLGVKDKQQLNNLQIVDNIGQVAIVSSAEAGTVFVSSNSNNARVLGVAPTTYKKGETLPCGLQLWLEAANNTLKSNKVVKRIQSDKAADVPSFITTKWAQESPYNKLCPQSNLKRCVTGCVATAMAQVMNYYKYPAQGTGSSTYTVTSTTNKTTEKTGEINGVYDWNNMLDSYSGSYTTAQATAVATLMRDCGYSVNMAYSTTGSGASDIYIPSALSTNFYYDGMSVTYLPHNYCSDEKWYDVIYGELAEQRPILFAGQSASQGGHEFVLDGMSADGLVHINWGWGGSYNGFFDLAVMSSYADFTLNQSIVYGFNPQPTSQSTVESYDTNIVVVSPELTTENGQLYFGGIVMNYDWRDFTGDIVFVVQSTTNPEDNSYGLTFLSAPEDGEEGDALPCGSGWQFSSSSSSSNGLLDFNSYFKDDGDNASDFIFPAGEYEVFIAYQGVNDKETKYAVTDGGVDWIQKITVANDGTITIGNIVTAIEPLTVEKESTSGLNDKMFNINGQRVGGSYKGLVIKNGKKFIKK